MDIRHAGALTLLKSDSALLERNVPTPHLTTRTNGRLGRRYLELTARWRQAKPRSTDKALTN